MKKYTEKWVNYLKVETCSNFWIDLELNFDLELPSYISDFFWLPSCTRDLKLSSHLRDVN